MNGLAPPSSPLSIGSLTHLTLSLVVIVALIFAISWAVKRFKLAAPGGGGHMAVIDQLALGPRERIVLVRVGDSQVLVAVGSGGIVGLTPLATRIELNAVPPAPTFADRLREFMKRPQNPA